MFVNRESGRVHGNYNVCMSRGHVHTYVHTQADRHCELCISTVALYTVIAFMGTIIFIDKAPCGYQIMYLDDVLHEFSVPRAPPIPSHLPPDARNLPQIGRKFWQTPVAHYSFVVCFSQHFIRIVQIYTSVYDAYFVQILQGNTEEFLPFL